MMPVVCCHYSSRRNLVVVLGAIVALLNFANFGHAAVSKVTPTKLAPKADHKQLQSRSTIVRSGFLVFQKLIGCDNSVIVLKCPIGSAVKVLSGTYGRTDNKTCAKWHHQPQTGAPSVSAASTTPLPPFKPCYRNETLTLSRLCSVDNSSKVECVILVDHKYQFTELPCASGLVGSPAKHHFAAVEFACAVHQRPANTSVSNRTVIRYVEPRGYVVEKGSEKLSHSVALRVLAKANMWPHNRDRNCIQPTSQGVNNNESSNLTITNGSLNDKEKANKRGYCVSLDGIRLKNIRHIIALKRKSTCNDIHIIGGTEVKNSDHLFNKRTPVVIDETAPAKKRAHVNGYRLDIAASDPSLNKANNAGMCISAYIRRHFQRVSPEQTSSLTLASMGPREQKQVVSWRNQRKEVYNDTSENGGVLYIFFPKPVLLWDILYP